MHHGTLSGAKALARVALPPRLYQGARALWHATRAIQEWAAALGTGIGYIAKRRPLPSEILFFGLAPGDDLLCTAVLRELRVRGRRRLAIMSDHEALFAGSDEPVDVIPVSNRRRRGPTNIAKYRRLAYILGRDFKQLEYAAAVSTDRSASPRRHIIAELCKRADVTGTVSLRPYLSLTEKEKDDSSWAGGHLVVQSSGMAGRLPMRNKQWYPERFQALVDRLRGEFDFIQLGSAMDPPLDHARDLRGATSIRQAAAILHHARLYIGTVGFLMHLARAVECPSVIVYGGRESPWQSGYICNANIYSPVPCAPCWRWNTCDFNRKCMDDISVDEVVLAIYQWLAKPRNPLAIETAEIAACSLDSEAR